MLVAAGHLDGVSEGSPIEDRYGFAEGVARTLERMSRSGPPRGPVTLATVTTDYPEERGSEKTRC